jgi:hypothetical protein
VSRLAWVGDTSRWYGLASTLVRGSKQRSASARRRLLVDGQHVAAVALDLLAQRARGL